MQMPTAPDRIEMAAALAAFKSLSIDTARLRRAHFGPDSVELEYAVNADAGGGRLRGGVIVTVPLIRTEEEG